MNYINYLQKNHFSDSTITVHELRIKRFKTWMKQYGVSEKHIDYKTLLHYVKYLQEEKNYKRASINNELRAVKLYFDYLIDTVVRVDNPAEDFSIKGKRVKVLKDLLSAEELEDLYYCYETHHYDTFFKASKQRDKVVLGFMIYQGMTAIELYHLQLEHLQLNKGKIDVPSTKRSNTRTLSLHPSQITNLMEYTNSTRTYLAKRIIHTNEEQFIFGSIDQMHAITSRIIRTLKKHNRTLKNYSQIRSSVIVNWLSKNNLREVQVMAGHRYISSTEKYLQDDLENLHEMVNNYHPIG